MPSGPFQNALHRTPQDTPPIWFMRQAGRYHTHYQQLRQRHSFMDLCKVPELAAKTALGPVQEFDFDVAILFSDLLFPLEAMGMGLNYNQGPPQLDWHVKTDDDIKRLHSDNDVISKLMFQKQALLLTRELLPRNKSLIGFVGAPWTLFSYAVQGSHDGSLAETKKRLPLFQSFCEKLLPLLTANISLQLDGSAEVVMVFDTAAGELDPATYHEFVVPSLENLAFKFPGQLGYYSKNTQSAHINHPLFTNSHWAGLGIDHRWDLNRTFDLFSSGFVQGNFDQGLLFLDPSNFKKTLEKYLLSIGKLSPLQRSGWICGLGHGVLPKTPEDNVKRFVDGVRGFFA